ncbi:MAG: HAMP domain-containing sensor histidine kinase [Bacteroidales bacterium]
MYRPHVYKWLLCLIISFLFTDFSLYADSPNTDGIEEALQKLKPLYEFDLIPDMEIPADSVIFLSEKVIPMLEREGEYDLLFKVDWLRILSYSAIGDISLAVAQAEEMLKKAQRQNSDLGVALACRAIGTIYAYTARRKEALESFKEALSLLQNIDGTEKIQKQVLISILSFGFRSKIDVDAQAYLNELDLLVDRADPDDRFVWTVLCGLYYVDKGNLEEARNCLAELKKIDLTGDPGVSRKYGFLSLSAYYNQVSGHYEEALDNYNDILHLLEEKKWDFEYKLVSKRKAEVCVNMKKYHEAALCYKILKEETDSLIKKSYVRQVNTLRALYKIDQLTFENKKRQNRILYQSILSVISLILLIVFFYCYLRRNNRMLAKSQQELVMAKMKAEQSIRSKSVFLSNMSHEIRTPLNAVVGFSSLLASDLADDPKDREQYQQIVTLNSKLLLKLFNDIIDFTSLEMKDMNFETGECDALEICRSVVNSMQQIKNTQAAVLFQSSLDTLKIETDKSRLQQVLLNLIINATKFTQQGSIVLAVEEVSADEVWFSVTDTGCGIPPEKQQQIFERFEKLNEYAQGSGLGLSICRLIIKRLGGNIWVDSSYSAGARFVFSHPVKQK